MEKFFKNGLLPAVTLKSEHDALKIAEVIQKAGLNVMEVPLRTKAASKSIKIIKQQFENLFVGAGTLLTPGQVKKAQQAGAQFGLAPGFNPKVAQKAIDLSFPFIPGVTTPSEVELALDMEFKILKFFPSEQLGGIDVLKSFNGPYAHTGVKFIPMGGISESNMKDYLALENVIAVGGSWIADIDLIKYGNMEEIISNIRSTLGTISNFKKTF